MRALLLLVALVALPAAAQPITFGWETSEASDTQGWTYVAGTGEGLAEAVQSFANAPGTPFEGSRSLEAGPRGDNATHPLTNQFRGARITYGTAIDLSNATDVSYQFDIYGSSPSSAVFEQRFRVVDGTGNTSEFVSNVNKNSWNAVAFKMSDLTGNADLSNIVEISVQGRNPDNRGNGDGKEDPWGGRIQLDAFTIARSGVSTEGRPGLAFLGRAFPNPTTSDAGIAVEVSSAQRVTATVYDALGRTVSKAFDAPLSAGARHTITLDLGALPSGLYLVRVEGETFAATRPVSVAR